VRQARRFNGVSRSTDAIRGAERRGIDLNDYPAVKRWHDAMAVRPAVQRGVAVLAEH
jgi:GST-like protein